MIDNRKVAEGIKLCANGKPCTGEKFVNCPFSPLNNADANCSMTMARNVLELLEEQENTIDTLNTLTLGYEIGAIKEGR